MQENQQQVNPAIALYERVRALAPEADRWSVDYAAQTGIGRTISDISVRAYKGEYGSGAVIARGCADTEEVAIAGFLADLAAYRAIPRTSCLTCGHCGAPAEPASDLRAESGGEEG